MVIRTFTSTATLLTLSMALGAVAPLTATPCSATYVLQNRKVVTVLPTGADDTANLRCAIDYAATLGPNVVVQLKGDTYKTTQLVVAGFTGTIRGAGKGKTILRNADTPLPITNPVAWVDAPPSYANPYPALISVTGKDVTLADLSIQIVGSNPVGDWYWFGGGPYHFADPAVLVLGSNVTLRTWRMEIITSGKCFPDPDGNVLVALALGNIGASSAIPVSASSRLLVDNSLIRSCVGVVASQVSNSVLEVVGTRLDTVRRAVIADGLSNSKIDILFNQVNASDDPEDLPIAIDLFAGGLGIGLENSSLLVSGNRIESGWVGVYLEPHSVSGSIACAMIGNNLQRIPDTGYGYWFGEGTYGCTVVGLGRGTVRDDTNGAHTIIGVTPHPDGAGHGVSGLMKGPKAPGLR